MSSGSDEYWKNKKRAAAEEKFLKETFPAGEYSVLTIMVRNDELTPFIEHMKKSGLRLAMFEGVKANLDFANPDVKGTKN